MSSVLRAYSQIPVRAKYLIVDISANPTGTSASTGEAFDLSAGLSWPSSAGSVMVDTELNKVAGRVDLLQGQLYRDLGRQVVVANADGVHLAHFRAAQRVSGPTTEGVDFAGAGFELFICVWSATAGQVSVSRTG
jgi:hypothetical protein